MNQSYEPVMAHPDNEWGHEYFPRISSDGKWLVYSATNDSCHDHYKCNYEVFIHRLGAGNGSREQLTDGSANDQWPHLYVGQLWQPPEPDVHLKINSGGGTSVAGWESEARYRTDGGPYTFPEVEVDLNGQPDPAPAEVYLTCIDEDHRYTFPVPDGSYRVRLHFFDKGESDRRMDYTIEGIKRLDDFNITRAAGGANKALIKDSDVEVSDGDGLQIVALKDQGNDAFESAIEIIRVTEQSSSVAQPGDVEPSPGTDADGIPGVDAGAAAEIADGAAGAPLLAASEESRGLAGGCTLAGEGAASVILFGLVLCALLVLRRPRQRHIDGSRGGRP